ncbi:MAG: thioredoxin domain-containing protein [Hydrogenophaga sp.]|jgi:protein-disulfide isomerase|uniref:DsbA family protein n=1 Tax=Hydrogenophaga sp. TaxID=1904254 RepID=UPI00262A1471|nr:thioredoxin domain-containing protein [Hydrogenophaga sp.]MDD3785546.1 thioredoxin domain-containing protein [Hydrogenophaga sp.]MDX9969336.1 thioredoxin domain-containing protein [Hydrogenophaga sp.]
MNSKKITVVALVAIVLVFFFLGMNAYQKRVQNSQAEKVSQVVQQAGSEPASKTDNRLVRFHSPVFGPSNAPVTIVEFFDPACETCRAFYPIVKDILKQYPNDVRLVIRYAPFHAGSDQVVKLLEAAKRQNKYQPVLEMILATQPQWADHGKPNIELAFRAAQEAGLDIAKAQADAQGSDIAAVLQQDIEDLTALEVTKTPTFFVNGRGLPSFGDQQLLSLVAEEVAKARK